VRRVATGQQLSSSSVGGKSAHPSTPDMRRLHWHVGFVPAKSRSLPPTVRTACYAPSVHAGAVQPAEDVDVAPDGGEVEAIARANIAVCGITIVQSYIDGNVLLDLGQ
jgi:hypothetical protein